MFSKEDVIKFIESIDEQLIKNQEVIDAYAGELINTSSDVLTLSMLSRDLMIIRKTWTDMLLRDYGIFYRGEVY